MFSAMLMIAHHIAGKATRDALFLTAFDVSQLPVMMMFSAAVSVGAVLGMSRLLARFGPARLMPPLYLASAVLLVLQWALAGSRPQVAAVVLYLQISALNSILISGFWSVINERFDPYEAKKVIARLTAATSLGGLVGGVSASVMASVANTNAILLMLAAMHLFCAAAVYYIGRGQHHAPHAEDRVAHMLEPLKRNPLIRRMAVLALLVATTAAVMDFILKSEAATNLSDEQLITFFSWFYMAVGLGTFLVQSAVGNRALRWLGLGGTMAAWPLAIMVTGAGALVLRSLVTVTLMRASANLLYNSFFRSGFELLYTPISPADKRTGKVLIDVGADRSGDMVGGFLVMGILLVPVATESLLIITAMVLASMCLLLILALHRGYVRQLADNLRSGQMQADDIEAVDATTIHTLALTQTALKRDSLLSEIAASRANGDSSSGATRAAEPPPGLDPVTEAIVDLRSGDASRIRRTLASRAMSPELIPHAIALLGNEHVLRDTLKAMRPSVSTAAGQLCDNLLSTAQSPLIRRRIPLLLAHSESAIAVQGLTTALDDTDWNVRFRCARALEAIRIRHPGLRPNEERVLHVVEREAADIASEGVTLSGNDNSHSRRISLLFHLFGAIYEPEPMELSLQALHSDDRTLQGTALEYLENRLPAHIWNLLQPSLSGTQKTAGPKRSLQHSVRDLLQAASALRSTKKPDDDDTAHELN